jgi:hypothetical protein
MKGVLVQTDNTGGHSAVVQQAPALQTTTNVFYMLKIICHMASWLTHGVESSGTPHGGGSGRPPVYQTARPLWTITTNTFTTVVSSRDTYDGFASHKTSRYKRCGG